MVITDVMLTASDGYDTCRGNSRVVVHDPSDTLASFAVGVVTDSRTWSNWNPVISASFESGIRVDPGVSVTIAVTERNQGNCDGNHMEVQYTISGYYAQP